ncbi:Hypothetical protein A7982_02527 [Minicystis rosea]|nr:Hypothetical protein A7982_02527 [Minicystis rosea]
MRARHPQTMLRLARERAERTYASIEAALSKDTRAALEHAIPAAWLPMEIDVEVIEAVTAELGAEMAAELVTARQREEIGSALFHTFVQTILRISGASPSTMVKQLPSGWKQLFRDAGTIEIAAIEANDASVVVRDLPRVCTMSAAWMSALPIGFSMLYEIIGVKGTVAVEPRSVLDGGVRLTFRWTKA